MKDWIRCNAISDMAVIRLMHTVGAWSKLTSVYEHAGFLGVFLLNPAHSVNFDTCDRKTEYYRCVAQF